MQCPVDNTRLVISDRQGVEVDYCPTCRGVWLDRGELDKLIARDNEFSRRGEHHERQSDYREEPRDRRRYDDDDDDDDYRSHGGHHGDKRHHKKEGFLGDLFDF